MANPVDELVIAITAETDEAVKGIKDVDKALDDTQKKAQETKKASRETTGAFGFLKGASVALTGAVVALGAALLGTVTGFRSFGDFIAQANQLELLTMKTGVSARELDAWSKAAEAAGGSSEALQASLQSFYAKTGRQATDFFKLADKIEGMSEGQKRRYLQAMGVNLDAVPLFMRGKDEVARLVARYRRDALSDEDIKKARQFKMIVHDFQDSLKGIGNTIARALLPFMKSLAEGFRDCINWIRENSRFLKTFGAVAVAVLGYQFLPLLTKLTLAFAKFGFSAKASLASILAFVAVISAIALAVEDLYVFAKGGDSWIGEFLGDTRFAKELKEDLNSIIDTFSDMWNTIKESEICNKLLGLLIKGIAFLAKCVAGALGFVIRFVSAIIGIGKAIWFAINAVGDFLSSLFSFDSALAIINAITSGINAIGNAINAVIAPAKELWETLSNSAVGKFIGKLFTPYGAENRNSENVSAEQARYQNNSSSVNTNAQINVTNNFPTTPNNPQAVGQAVGRTVASSGRRYAQIVGNSYSGVNMVGG